MGLDFSHGDAHWSYSGFNDFREWVARLIGLNLADMDGFGGLGSWDDVDDPLVPLLNHSDCDGELSVAECQAVAPRLRSVLAEAQPSPAEEHHVAQGMRLVDAMEQAIAAGEPLVFW
jgi:hypothetical protein